MAILHNEITIDTNIGIIWDNLADLELLEKYDPTVKRSVLVSSEQSGLGAKRKVHMKDGKNWFEEEVTVFKPNEALTFQLTACSFPIKKLKHSYSFENQGKFTKVKQVMEYTVKYGLLGSLLDRLMIRKQSDKGIKKFFRGLKSFVENH